jgi:hypothetical protein
MIITEEPAENGGQPGFPVEAKDAKAWWSKSASSCGGFGPVYSRTYGAPRLLKKNGMSMECPARMYGAAVDSQPNS